MATEGQTRPGEPRRSSPALDPLGLTRERLLDREEQLRTAQEMAEFGIWEWDIPAGTVEWSDQLFAIYGTTPEDYSPTYEGYIQKIHPDDRERIAAAISKAYADHEAFQFDERIVRPDGEVRTLHSRGRVVVDEDGNALRMIGVCQDVTAQRHAEAEIRETAARLAEAQAIAAIGSWDWDVEHDVVIWSDEMYRIYGLDPTTFHADYTGFLQHVHRDDRERVDQAIQHAFAAAAPFSVEHRIIRADGVERVLQSNGRAIADETGRAVRMVGTGHDVTDQRASDEHAAAASAALGLAQRMADLQLITETALSHLGLDELLPELLERIRQALGVESAAVFLMDEDGETLELRAARGPGSTETGLRIAVGGGFAGRVAAERKTLVIGEQAYDHVISDALRAARLESMVGVPLFLRGNVFGVLHIGSVESRSFGPDEIALIELTAERAAMAIDHARIYERERGIAETLQRALLPAKLPELDRMSAAVRYVPAAEGVDIGGDWYDVVQLPNGNVGVVMGDVTGHGIEAAALMALLRHGVRAYALEGLDPAQIAGRLDRLIYTPDLERLATLVYAEVAVDGALAFVNAGHLPPLVVAWDGATRFLDVLGGLPIGCQSADGYRTEHGRLDDGETLVLYTDGLIERRGESIDDGLERLAETAASAPDNPHDLADHLLRQLLPGSGGEDDIALMTVRTEPVPAPPA